MRGYGNHFYLQHCKFLGNAITKKNYSLHVLAGIPMVHDDEHLYPVHGEVYLVDNETLKDIDELEGNGEWYTRRIETVFCDGLEMNVWVYFNNEIGVCLSDGKFIDIF